MRKIFTIFILTFVIAVGGYGFVASLSVHEAKAASAGFADLADKLLPAVVNISSTQKMEQSEHMPDMPQFPPGSPFEDFFEEFMDRRGPDMPSTPPASLGSGFIIDAKNGYIVTNNHVVRDAQEVRVTFHDDETLTAEVIGRDEKTDLAVLQVKTDKKLVSVHFGNSSIMRVGDWIVAIGNPFGLGGTVTAGIISARQRDINSGPYDDYLQTDASINRGNSGGPMFNLNGEVIGINTAIFSPSGGSVGIGFAIPSALAKPIIDQIIQYGRTRRGWLGVRIQSVTDEIAESLGLDNAKGALIATVNEKGPAQKAGLEAGDIILEFNSRSINEMRELPRVVAETPVNTKAKVIYWRDNKKSETKVEIGELEKAEETGLLETAYSDGDKIEGTKIDKIGLSLKPLSEEVRRTFKINQTVNGVLITDVDASSEASKKGLSGGDIIVEINQKGVTTPKDVQETIEQTEKAGRNSVLLLVNRDGEVRFVAIRLDKAE